MRFSLGRVLTILVALYAAGPLSAATKVDQVRDKLVRLQENDLWGEAMLAGGQIRSIKVDSLSSDSVAVNEVLGALQRHAAVYALADIRSLRELGVHRIPLRRAPYRSPKSMIAALGLEILVPGGGYFYLGESRQGLALLGFASAAVATAFATRKDGIAGWAPIVTWVKIASLLHLGDEVDALNRSYQEGVALGLGPTPDAAGPALQLGWSF